MNAALGALNREDLIKANVKLAQAIIDGYWGIPLVAPYGLVAYNGDVIESWNGTMGVGLDGIKGITLKP